MSTLSQGITRQAIVWRIAIASILVAMVDLLAKYIVQTSLPLYEMRPLVPQFLSIYHTTNPGIAFSLSVPRLWLMVSTLVII
jgi:lipoprotein signal peptidase